MGKEHLVEIPSGSGNRYRYEYSDGATRYLGPAGQAPELGEAEFYDMLKGKDFLHWIGTVEGDGLTTGEGEINWVDLGGAVEDYGGQPVILIGPAGSGKTTLVQEYADMKNWPMTTVSLHTGIEKGDLIGREVYKTSRKKVWQDGPLIKAMKEGHLLVLDEYPGAQKEVKDYLMGILKQLRAARDEDIHYETPDGKVRLNENFAIILTSSKPVKGWPDDWPKVTLKKSEPDIYKL